MDDHIKGMESQSSHASEQRAIEGKKDADDEAIDIDPEDNMVVKITDHEQQLEDVSDSERPKAIDVVN